MIAAANKPLPDDLPVLSFTDAVAWETWLVANAASKGLWLKIAKKDSGIATVTYDQALEVALCHGWIDGQKRGFDSDWFLQRFTPRKARSVWSQINRDHVARLTAAGRMTAHGQRHVGRILERHRDAQQHQVRDPFSKAYEPQTANRRVQHRR